MKDVYDQRGQGHFVFSKTNTINFCISIDESARSRFQLSSIEIQTRSAVNQWATALSTQPFFVNLVSCDSPRLNLLIDISPGPSAAGFPANQTSRIDGTRSYSQIRINTLYEYRLKNGEYRKIFDFGALAQKSVTPMSVEQLVQFASDPTLEVAQIAHWAKMETVEIKISTYPMLLHEIGHSFGLCDTDDEQIDASCNPGSLSGGNPQPTSIMKSTGGTHLLDDDIAGIKALYVHFGETGLGVPAQVQADVLNHQIIASIKANDNKRTLRFLADYHNLAAQGVEFPLPLLYEEARLAKASGDYPRSRDALRLYLNSASKTDRRYDQAVQMYSELEAKP